MRTALGRGLKSTWLALVCCAVAIGCGNSETTRTQPPGSTTDGSTFDGFATDGSPDTLTAADGTTGDAGGAIAVTIQTPTASAVVAGASLDVVARVVPSGATVDTSSIEAELVGSSLPASHLVADGPDTFKGQLAIRSLQSGDYNLIVRAATIDGGRGEAVVQIKVNAGPIITILRPAPNEPIVNTLNYDFTVRISPALTGISVGTVTAVVGNCTITLPTPTASGEYIGSRDLTTCSPQPGQGQQQLTITAADNSNPAVASTRSTIFVIDRAGPAISILSPRPASLVGGIITVRASVSDASGVNPFTVFASISHSGMDFTFPLSPAGQNYEATFDLHRLPNSTEIQFPAVEVVADDALGNHSATGGLLFTIDNVPPAGELDPPDAIVVREDGNNLQCSRPFDPLGGDAAGDLSVVPQIFDIRAQVMDEGNLGVGSQVSFHSAVSRVTLFLLSDNSRPLVVDSDGDAVCDKINPQVIASAGMTPGPSQALALEMTTIPPRGGADFSGTYSTPLGCAPGNEADPQKPLCPATQMLIAVHDNDGNPLIWTLPPVVANKLQCDGLQFDALANNVPDGWICAAAAFSDGVGNTSVTRPIRVCLNKSGGMTCSGGTAPNCTGTLNPMTNMVTTTACTPRPFSQRFFEP